MVKLSADRIEHDFLTQKSTYRKPAGHTTHSWALNTLRPGRENKARKPLFPHPFHTAPKTVGGERDREGGGDPERLRERKLSGLTRLCLQELQGICPQDCTTQGQESTSLFFLECISVIFILESVKLNHLLQGP